jgi:hypothetical protein
MPNKAPVAVLKAEPTELTWPDDVVTLDLTESYDPNRKGTIEKYEFKQVDPAEPKAVIDASAVQKATVRLLQPGGTTTFNFKGTVTDKGGLTGEATVGIKLIVPAVKVKCSFGVSGPTIGNDFQRLKDLCGFPSVTRHMVILNMYHTGSPDRGVETAIKSGIPIFLNCNLDNVGRDNDGNKVPNPFPTDMDMYRKKLTPVLKWYADNYPDELEYIIPVCENEPTTENFHSGPMSDYLRMLGEVFVPVCQELGYKKFTDGGVHTGAVLGADSTQGEGKAKDVRDLLLGYKNIPLWRVAMHTSNTGSTYRTSSIPEACGVVGDLSGHKVVSNEWHVQTIAGKYAATTNTLKQVMQGWADAAAQGYGIEYSVYISGTTEKDEELNIGDLPTEFGKAYRAFIDTYTRSAA